MSESSAPPSLEVPTEPASLVQRGLERMAFVTWLLDDCIELPGTHRRVGLDGVIGLVPGAGDALAGLFQLYLLLEASHLGVGRGTLGRMLANIAVDTLVGCVPIIGDLFDFAFKSSTRNLALARADLVSHGVIAADGGDHASSVSAPAP